MKTSAFLLAIAVAIVTTCQAQDALPSWNDTAPFGGKIGATYKESTPDFPKSVAAPKDAPNVLLILTDDTGFGHAATFGGAAATPTLDRLSKSGLRYNRLHTTALCSPSRGALLTGPTPPTRRRSGSRERSRE